MFATFVIGLREGLEAALIVGIVAAFLSRNGRRDSLLPMWGGVAAAVALCAGAGIALNIYSRELPQRQQEGLETVIGVVAVAMVTYMIVWMKVHARDLKGSLESAAQSALGEGSTRALVLMAFLAVLREGLETAVFLLAAVNASSSGFDALIGAVLGIAASVALGYGIYRGGVRLDLSKFFRATGLVLTFVAAGLVMSAFHTAHEAGWLHAGQQQILDLRWLVAPGSVQSSLLTGVLGLQPRPTLIEAVGWLVYLMPVATIVLWPPAKPVPYRILQRGLVGLAVAGLIAAAALPFLAPAKPTQVRSSSIRDLATSTRQGDFARRVNADPADWTVAVATLRKVSPSGAQLVIDGQGRALTRSGWQSSHGARLWRFRGETSRAVRAASIGAPASSSLDTLISGGRLPLGLSAQTMSDPAKLRYREESADSVLVNPATHQLVDVRHESTIRASTFTDSGAAVDLGTLRIGEAKASTAQWTAAAAAAVAASRTLEQHNWMRLRSPLLLVILAGAAAAGAASIRRRPTDPLPGALPA